MQQQQQQQQLPQPKVYVPAFTHNGLGKQQRLQVHELMEEQPNLSLWYLYNFSRDQWIATIVREILNGMYTSNWLVLLFITNLLCLFLTRKNALSVPPHNRLLLPYRHYVTSRKNSLHYDDMFCSIKINSLIFGSNIFLNVYIIIRIKIKYIVFHIWCTDPAKKTMVIVTSDETACKLESTLESACRVKIARYVISLLMFVFIQFFDNIIIRISLSFIFLYFVDTFF